MNPAGLLCGSFGFSLSKRSSANLAGLPDLPEANPAAQRGEGDVLYVAKSRMIRRTSLRDLVSPLKDFGGVRRETFDAVPTPTLRFGRATRHGCFYTSWLPFAPLRSRFLNLDGSRQDAVQG